MGETFTTWLTGPAPPLWIAFLVGTVVTIRTAPIWKQKLTEARAGEAAISAQLFTQLQSEVTRLGERVQMMDGELQACHLERDQERAGRLAAEALLLGRGMRDQEVQVQLSAEREADRHGKRPGNER